jgi:hypothetical protein
VILVEPLDFLALVDDAANLFAGIDNEMKNVTPFTVVFNSVSREKLLEFSQQGIFFEQALNLRRDSLLNLLL